MGGHLGAARSAGMAPRFRRHSADANGNGGAHGLPRLLFMAGLFGTALLVAVPVPGPVLGADLEIGPDVGPSTGIDRLGRSFEARLGERIADAAYPMQSHEAADGPRLVADVTASHDATHYSDQGCPAGVEVKFYQVAAVETKIFLNRWGDNDPAGRIYTALEHVDAVRALGRATAEDHYGISLGVGDDLVQPLTLRANVGDCLRVTLTNLLEEPTSFHVHGADLVLAGTGAPALSTNADATVFPNETVAYEWYIDPAFYGENTHYAHPHGPASRFQVTHGLFGAVIVEPPGSEYLNPRTGEKLCGEPGADDGARACTNSWDAIISPGEGHDFREYAVFYHEVGNEDFNVRDHTGFELDAIDPVTVTYKPSGRAINYRSESFRNRLIDMDAANSGFYRGWNPDASLAYSSYSFGDPSTPVPQSYLGDPVKFRLIHGGSETFHVPHLHGGGVQWQTQPHLGLGEADYVPLNAGLQKQFAASMPSSGNDSQTIGPSETYDLEVGCGSGGCQQSVGDFLFHCHIASHYIAGMWHFWRVYNTLQDGPGKTDDLASVVELPDRQGAMERAVSSDRLIGETVAFGGREIAVDEAGLSDLVEAQLPPRGVPRDVQDAQVFDWSREGNVYLNEPETEHVWPNFASPSPLARPRLMFAAATGHLAWPFLRPHLGERPPFAPHHGPSPYLEPLGHAPNAPPAPGANGDASVCPEGAPVRTFKIHAIQLPIDIAPRETMRNAMLFVLQEEEAAVRADEEMKVPLAIRANQGDCVDVVLINELEGLRSRQRPLPFLTKTNIHVHFFQFDVQASDGVPTGAAFEQAIRPFRQDDQATQLRADIGAGASRLTVGDAGLFHPGASVAVGMDQPLDIFEIVEIAAIEGSELVLAEPLQNAHRAGEQVSVEFVRYRWYVARQNGAVYFHDHVDALNRWGRGLFGALIAEPRDATFHDPQTGTEIVSGPIADIYTEREVVPGLEGSFREFVLFFGDRTPDVNATINLRAEPVNPGSRRGRSRGNELFSSERHGDPMTPVLQAYAGDPIMLRVLAAATEELHPLIFNGHQFRRERFQANSPLTNNITVGISERFNGYIPSAGGPNARPGDYLFYNGIERHFIHGAWGLMRVHANLTSALNPLPGRPPPGEERLADGADSGPGNPCPAGVPVREIGINVVALPITINTGGRASDSTDRREGPQFINGRRYVLDTVDDDRAGSSHDGRPLVIRANAGDCLEVRLTNRTNNAAGFNVEGATFDPSGSYGGAIGNGSASTTGAGQSRLYRFWLAEEYGALRIRDFGNPFVNIERQLYGALIVEPVGATYHDPVTDAPIGDGVAAVIRLPDGSYFREFAALLVDHDIRIGRFVMPYQEEVRGDASINYRSEPLERRAARLGRIDDPRQALLYDTELHGPPETALFVAEAGDDIRFRVISAYSEQPPVFSVEGHDWALTPELVGSDIVSARVVPSSGTINARLRNAGGPAGRPGDYLWSNHRLPYLEAGQWGLLRILAVDSEAALGPRRGTVLFSQLRL